MAAFARLQILAHDIKVDYSTAWRSCIFNILPELKENERVISCLFCNLHRVGQSIGKFIILTNWKQSKTSLTETLLVIFSFFSGLSTLNSNFLFAWLFDALISAKRAALLASLDSFVLVVKRPDESREKSEEYLPAPVEPPSIHLSDMLIHYCQLETRERCLKQLWENPAKELSVQVRPETAGFTIAQYFFC